MYSPFLALKSAAMFPSSRFEVQTCNDALWRLRAVASVGITKRKHSVAFEEATDRFCCLGVKYKRWRRHAKRV